MFLQISYWGMMKVALPVLPRLHLIFNAPERLVHLMISLSFILAGLSAMIWGPIIDRLRLKVFILITVILTISALINATLATYFWDFAIFYIASCILVTSHSVYSRSFPLLYLTDASEIKKSLSFRLMGGFGAAFMAPFIGGLISERYGWRYTFVFIILWLLFLLIISYYIGQDNVAETKISKFSDNIKQTFGHLKNNNFRRYLIILGCGNAVSQSYIVSIPFWLSRTYHVPSSSIALYLLPLLLPGMLLPLCASYLIHYIKEEKLILGYLVVFILSGILPFLLMLISLPPAWIWLVPGVLANLSMVGLAPILTYDSLTTIKSHRSTASGLLSTSSYLFGGGAMYVTLFIELKVFYLEGSFILLMAGIMCLMLFLITRSAKKKYLLKT